MKEMFHNSIHMTKNRFCLEIPDCSRASGWTSTTTSQGQRHALYF